MTKKYLIFIRTKVVPIWYDFFIINTALKSLQYGTTYSLTI